MPSGLSLPLAFGMYTGAGRQKARPRQTNDANGQHVHADGEQAGKDSGDEQLVTGLRKRGYAVRIDRADKVRGSVYRIEPTEMRKGSLFGG